MSLKDELTQQVAATFESSWSTRTGQVVPQPETIRLSNDAVKLSGTVLYADLAESTDLVRGYKDWFAAEVYKSYLYCAARLIGQSGGVVTAYDGDRVMGVFIGDSKNSNAAKCALKINWVVHNIIRPKISAQFPNCKYVLQQRVGIDTSDLFVARTGVRGTNDLVWVGNAANNAAKLAALSLGYSTYISKSVYDVLSENLRFSGDPKKNMWNPLGLATLNYSIYGSNYWWSV